MKALHSKTHLFELLHFVLLLVFASNFAASLPLESSGNVETTVEATWKATSQAHPIRSLALVLMGPHRQSAETMMKPKAGFISSEVGLKKRWKGSKYVSNESSFHQQDHGVYQTSENAEEFKKYSSKSIERFKTDQIEETRKGPENQNISTDGEIQNISTLLGRKAEEKLSHDAIHLVDTETRDYDDSIEVEDVLDPDASGFKEHASGIVRSDWQTEKLDGDARKWMREPYIGDNVKATTRASAINVLRGSQRNSNRSHPEPKESTGDEEEEEEFDSSQYESTYIEAGQDYGEDVEVVNQLLFKPDDPQSKRRTDSRKRKVVPTRKRTFRGPRPTSVNNRNNNNGGTKRKVIPTRKNLSSKSKPRLSPLSSYVRAPAGNHPSSSAAQIRIQNHSSGSLLQQRKQATYPQDTSLGQFHTSREEFHPERSRSELIRYASINSQGQNHRGIPHPDMSQFGRSLQDLLPSARILE